MLFLTVLVYSENILVQCKSYTRTEQVLMNIWNVWPPEEKNKSWKLINMSVGKPINIVDRLENVN